MKVGELHRLLIDDLTRIKNICQNSNPTYKTRIQQILAIVEHREQSLKL